LEDLKVQQQRLEKELGKLGFQPGQEEEMYQQQSGLQQRIRTLRQESDALKRKVANIDFNYHDPVPNFDRSKVKGLVAQLFTLDKDHTEAGTALEICAGGRLYNVVVDSEVTGTQLLKGGKLRKRVTIIPLNKIAAFKASAQTIATAQKIAPGKVDLALSLVGYDDEEAEKKVAVETTVTELEAALQEKTKAYEAIKAKYDAAKDEVEAQGREADSKEELLQTLQTGVASKAGQEGGYQGQLQDARNRAT
ncbi:hypothetical protein BN1723_016793, partial [Verticillium longisporum]